MEPKVQELVPEARVKHARWGPRKLLAWLAKREPDVELPVTGGDNPADVGTSLAKVLQAACMQRIQQRATPAHGTNQSLIGNHATDLLLSTGTGDVGHYGTARNLLNGETVYGADVYYPDQTVAADVAGTPVYATFIASGSGYNYTFLGCRGSITKISGEGRKGCVMEFKFMVSNWTRSSTATTAGETFPAINPQLVGLNSPFFWTGTATTSTPISGFELDLGMAFSTVVSTESTHGNAGFQPNALKPVLKVKPYLDSQWGTDFANELQDIAFLQIGNKPGHAVALALPYARITKYPGEADHGGVVGHDVEFTGYNSTSGGPLAPVYIAFY